mmetsp:Transcript_10449/g.45396  ORF Transcript_10449/g.45396 Transcript_10449/m.45396 type:complete len:171 (-) Transcript_10449:256-768(-)
METRSKRSKTEPIVEKIRRGEISVFVAVAEELPEVFRTHVVPKLGMVETLGLACVNKSYNAAVWSVEALRSLDEKAKDYPKPHDMSSIHQPLHICSLFNNVKAITLLAALSSKHCGDGVIRPRPQTARPPAKLGVRGHVGHRNRRPRRARRTCAGGSARGGRRARPDTRF